MATALACRNSASGTPSPLIAVARTTSDCRPGCASDTPLSCANILDAGNLSECHQDRLLPQSSKTYSGDGTIPVTQEGLDGVWTDG